MKKLLALAMSLTMIFAFAACGSKDNSEGSLIPTVKDSLQAFEGDITVNWEDISTEIEAAVNSAEEHFENVVKEIISRIIAIDSDKIKFTIIDAPLLFESKLDRCCDYVISLIADFDLKVKRICKRDNIDEETAKSRLNIQNKDSFYIEKSDFVIYNSENSDLKAEIDEIFNKLD